MPSDHNHRTRHTLGVSISLEELGYSLEPTHADFGG
jgi:hypothetical protein